jgi:uncharacterized protein (DUF58 family)
MPTGRAGAVLIGALVLYFFANQTQVGWLYVMSALLAGVIGAGWWLSRGTLRGISGMRRLGDGLLDEWHEGDPVTITFRLSKSGRGAGAQIRLNEVCPLAEPAKRVMPLYIPQLPAGGAVEFNYELDIYRRGVYAFPPLTLTTGVPFGFFRRSVVLDVPTRALVYPEVRYIERIDLLDRQLTPQVTRQKAGVGYEVFGLRPYRPGDSPRHIHWRSVARAGGQQLFSKEFADETQPGLVLALDLFAHPYAATESKHTPFEWAVKIAASVGDYARRRQYPLLLVTNDRKLPAPSGALPLPLLLEYLTRVEPTGDEPLRVDGIGAAFVIAVLPYPDEAAGGALRALAARRLPVLAYILDPVSFPAALEGADAAAFAAGLRADGVETRLIQYGEDWTR